MTCFVIVKLLLILMLKCLCNGSKASFQSKAWCINSWSTIKYTVEQIMKSWQCHASRPIGKSGWHFGLERTEHRRTQKPPKRKKEVLWNGSGGFWSIILVRLPLQPTTPHGDTPSMAVRAIPLSVCHRRTAQGLPDWIQTMFGRAVPSKRVMSSQSGNVVTCTGNLCCGKARLFMKIWKIYKNIKCLL